MKFMPLFFLFLSVSLFSQEKESSCFYSKINWNTYNLNTKKKPLWKKSIVPAVFGISAISINYLPLKQDIQDKIRAPFNGYKTKMDDYIQYAPIGIMYGADLLKVKAEHSVWNQTKFLVISELTTSAIVHTLKYTLKIARPNNGARNSFPSGHTSQAFVASQVLYNEYKNTSPILAYSGYLFSISTGALRMVNNRHWLPDVLLGAGIGMFVTNVVYHFEALKNWNPFGKSKSNLSLQAFPVFKDDYSGLSLRLTL